MTVYTHIVTASNKKASQGVLVCECALCGGVVEVDVVKTPNLPACTPCGDTNWIYELTSIDILRENEYI